MYSWTGEIQEIENSVVHQKRHSFMSVGEVWVSRYVKYVENHQPLLLSFYTWDYENRNGLGDYNAALILDPRNQLLQFDVKRIAVLCRCRFRFPKIFQKFIVRCRCIFKGGGWQSICWSEHGKGHQSIFYCSRFGRKLCVVLIKPSNMLFGSRESRKVHRRLFNSTSAAQGTLQLCGCQLHALMRLDISGS